MSQMGQPIDYLDTKEWTAFLQKASKDYGDLIKELDIKL
jgi:tripartite-type tricarboxylate transporter receptor subunit TctC